MSRWLTISILFSSCIAAYDYYANPTGRYYIALGFLTFTILLIIADLRHRTTITLPQLTQVAWRGFKYEHILATILGMACCMMLAIIQRSDSPTFALHFTYQFGLWVLGLALIGYGMSGGFGIQEIQQTFGRWIQTSEARWLLVIILFGFLVRVVALHTAFPNYIDEGAFAKAIVTLREKPDIKIMSSMDYIANFTWIYAYWQYLYTELFGANLGTLRVVSAIIGTLTIPAIYLMGRWTFGKRIGLLAALLLAIDLPHLHFSRLGLNNIADPLFGVLAIAFLARGLQTRSRRSMALAGVFLGMTGYFYEGGRLLYPALLIGWLAFYTIIQQFKVPKRGIVLFLLSAVLVTSVYYLSKDTITSDTLAPRLTLQGRGGDFWMGFFADGNLFQSLLHYNQDFISPAYLHIMSQPDGSRFYYGRNLGIILPHLLPFFLIGLGVALFYWRRFGAILLFWVLLTVLGNSLIIWNNWTPRFVVAFPALVMLIALGLDWTYQQFVASWHQHVRMQRLLPKVAVAILLLMSVGHITYYFRVLLIENSHAYRQKMDDQDAAYRAQLLPPDSEVYVIHIVDIYHLDIDVMQAYEKHDIIVHVLGSDIMNYNRLDITPDHPYAFFVDPKDDETISNLKRIFDDALIGPTWSPYNVPEVYQFALYQVNPS